MLGQCHQHRDGRTITLHAQRGDHRKLARLFRLALQRRQQNHAAARDFFLGQKFRRMIPHNGHLVLNERLNDGQQQAIGHGVGQHVEQPCGFGRRAQARREFRQGLGRFLPRAADHLGQALAQRRREISDQFGNQRQGRDRPERLDHLDDRFIPTPQFAQQDLEFFAFSQRLQHFAGRLGPAGHAAVQAHFSQHVPGAVYLVGRDPPPDQPAGEFG